jgi:hypothetical protein
LLLAQYTDFASCDDSLAIKDHLWKAHDNPAQAVWPAPSL